MPLTPNAEPPRVREPFVGVVAGGNHVAILVDAEETDGAFDAVEVLARPGGGPPPHCHAFAEWFRILEGTLTFTGVRDGRIVPIAREGPGRVVVVPPGAWHGTINETSSPVRFTVVGRPGVMSRYFRKASVAVRSMDEPPSTEPPGPAELLRLAESLDIRFWSPSAEPPRGT